MDNKLNRIHQLLAANNALEAQDVFRQMLFNLPENDVLSQVYILKAYELNAGQSNSFGGLSSKQLEAHSLIVRQLLIENSEEFDRRVSRMV